MMDYLILMAVGLVAGTLGGLLGVGGSIVMIPGMTFVLEPNQHLFQGAAMIVNFFVVIPAVFQHYKADAILKPIVRVTIPTSVVGVLIGVWLSGGAWFAGDREVYLARVFGGFLCYVAAYNVYRLMQKTRLPDVDNAKAAEIAPWKTATFVGLPMGIVGGLLGIGGGALAVPFQQAFLKLPLRRAIANSAATILSLSLVGAAYKTYTNHQAGIPASQALKIAITLIPTAFLGGYIGAHLTHRIPRKALRIAFILLMLYSGYRMLTREPSTTASRTPIAQAKAVYPARGDIRDNRDSNPGSDQRSGFC